jgi:hypothetical protein
MKRLMPRLIQVSRLEFPLSLESFPEEIQKRIKEEAELISACTGSVRPPIVERKEGKYVPLPGQEAAAWAARISKSLDPKGSEMCFAYICEDNEEIRRYAEFLRGER